MDGIQSDDGINGLQVAFTTGLQFDQLVGNRIQRTVGQEHAVDFSDMAADISITVAQAKQGDDLAFQLIGQMGLMLFDQLWFEAARAVVWRLKLKLSDRAFHSLGRTAILAVGFIRSGQMGVQLRLYCCFGQLFDRGGSTPSLPLRSLP